MCVSGADHVLAVSCRYWASDHFSLPLADFVYVSCVQVLLHSGQVGGLSCSCCFLVDGTAICERVSAESVCGVRASVVVAQWAGGARQEDSLCLGEFRI